MHELPNPTSTSSPERFRNESRLRAKLSKGIHALGTLAAAPKAGHALPALHHDRRHALRFPGMFGTIRVYDLTWEDGRPVRVMDVGGSMQSATYTDSGWCDPVFEYYVLYDLMFLAPTPPRNVLMLGGAGYGYPKYFISTYPEGSITVVEKDPMATKLARKYFYLNRLERTFHTKQNGRLRLVNADALDFLGQGESGNEQVRSPRYDAILNDCFCAGHADASLTTPAAAHLVHERLVPQGVYLSNVVSAVEGPRARTLRRATEAISTAFEHVYAVSTHRNPPELDDNIMVVASDAELDLPFAEQFV